MADFFGTEEVVKGYDGTIVSRILAYLKPYPILTILLVIALAGATLGELRIPVIQRQVIDEAILARTTVVYPEIPGELSPAARQALEELLSKPGYRIGDALFVRNTQGGGISGAAETELRNLGILSTERWYAFPLAAEDPALAVIAGRPELFLTSDDAAAIKIADLYRLPLKDIRAVRGRDLDFIAASVISLLLMLLLVFIFTFTQIWIASLLGQRVMKDLRLALFKKTASQSTDFLSRNPVGRIVTRLTGDVETINEFFSSVLVALLKDISIMAGVLVTLFILSPKLALATICTMPPVIVVTAISRLKARDAFRRQRTASSRVNSYLSERLSGVQVVQLFRGEEKSGKEFALRNRELMDANLGEMFVFATFRPLVEWLAAITAGTIIVVGSGMVLDLSLSLGSLIAFINLISMFYHPVMDIAEKYTILQSAMAGGERVFALLDTEERIPDTGERSLGKVRGLIEFRDVHFSYGPVRAEGEGRAEKGQVLKGLSFTVQPGEMAAIVGYTGAGKTTITNVLARLWDIDSGSVMIDSVPIGEIPLDELRHAALPVLQDVFLFSGTVEENISLGLPLSQAKIEEAARAVYAHDFITQLPQGYKTPLSEGATNISTGQRQLISFARVIAHDPAIVILDEATASIDTETERLIQLGIERILAGRTSLVIAHRLSTIRHADRILTLSDGRLAEEGRHEDLIRAEGLYAGLYKLQYEGGTAE